VNTEKIFKTLKKQNFISSSDLVKEFSVSRPTALKMLKLLAEKYSDFLKFVEGDNRTSAKLVVTDREAFTREYRKLFPDEFKEEIIKKVTKLIEDSPQKYFPIETIMNLFKKEGLTIDYAFADEFINRFVASHSNKIKYKSGIADKEWAFKQDLYPEAQDVRHKIALALLDNCIVSILQIAKWYWNDFNTKRKFYLEVAKKEAKYLVERPWILTEREPKLQEYFNKGFKLHADNKHLILSKQR